MRQITTPNCLGAACGLLVGGLLLVSAAAGDACLGASPWSTCVGSLVALLGLAATTAVACAVLVAAELRRGQAPEVPDGPDAAERPLPESTVPPASAPSAPVPDDRSACAIGSLIEPAAGPAPSTAQPAMKDVVHAT